MNIFEYEDYRLFLSNFIRSKSQSRGEYRRIAEYLGVHPTLISQVFSGGRNFSPEQIMTLAKHYGFGKIESKYLLLLVEIERAGSVDVRNQFIEMRDEIRNQSLQLSKRVESARKLSDFEKSVFYSSWIYSAIHLLTTLEKAVDFDFICKRLNVTPVRAREVIDFLKTTGLISEMKGKFISGATSTHLEKGSPFLVKHHTNWRVRALEKTENLNDTELMYSVNVSLSEKDFERLREQIIKFIKEFLATVHNSPAEDIAQLNIDFFWI